MSGPYLADPCARCGHSYNWHVSTRPECDWEGCKCESFVPADVTVELPDSVGVAVLHAELREAEQQRSRLEERFEYLMDLLDRVVVQGGAQAWTGRDLLDWCCDYKDIKNGYSVEFIRKNSDHVNCGHRHRDGQDLPADHWKIEPKDARIGELESLVEDCLAMLRSGRRVSIGGLDNTWSLQVPTKRVDEIEAKLREDKDGI